MNVEQLETLIEEHGLTAVQDQILAAVRPAILLRLGEAGAGGTGGSRIGGTPDLPPSLAWPHSRHGSMYLCFLLQLNFAELPAVPGDLLPRRGMLYLFADEASTDAQQLVVYTGDERLQPTQVPSDADFVVDWYDNIPVHQLGFEPILDIPRWATTDYTAIIDQLPEDEAQLDELARALSAGSIGRLLGHVSGIGHDPREDAFVVREVNPEWLYNYEQRRGLDMAPARSWLNLLEVYSIGALDLTFGDAGYMQVLIREQDLARQRFDNVYVELQSS